MCLVIIKLPAIANSYFLDHEWASKIDCLELEKRKSLY